MRRVLGAIFVGLAAFLLVIAALARFYLPGQVIKFPLNEYSVSSLTGTNVSYFSEQTGQPVSGARVLASNTTQGDVKDGSASTACWANVLGVFDVTSTQPPTTPISYSSDRLAFNRRTGQLVNDAACGPEVGTKRVNFSSQGQGVVWPIGVQKQTYQVFDTTLLKKVPAVYAGTATVDGFSTYVFDENVDRQKFGSISLPGSLVGMPGKATVTLPEYLTAHTVTYVDPGTGSPIKLVETENESLVNPATGATALTLFNGTLVSSQKSIASAISTAKPDDNEIMWVQDLGPLIALIVGLLLGIGGVLLVMRSERQGYEWEYDEQEVAAGA